MPIPFLSLFQKKEKQKYYLAILLRENKATAVLFEERLSKIHFFSKGEANFKKSIEEDSLEDFVTTLDTAISTAENKLLQQIDTHQTVFAVKENWISDSTIKKNIF